jgi:hypothetical protein
MKVIHYDKYYDIPTRGIISFEGRYLPFLAEVDQHCEDSRWVKGVPVTTRLFPAVASLERDFELVTSRFKRWKTEGAANRHPLLADAEYQDAIKRIDDCFNQFPGHTQLVSGFFSNDGESWYLELG